MPLSNRRTRATIVFNSRSKNNKRVKYGPCGLIRPDPTFELVSSKDSVNEGDSFDIELIATGVYFGQRVPYTISGVNSGDISGKPLTGEFIIDSYDGKTSITFNVTEDLTSEGDEIFTLTLNDVNVSVNVNINDTSKTQLFDLSVDNTIVDETNNNTFTVTLSTGNVDVGEEIGYNIIGTGITQSDFISGGLTGNFVVGVTDSITFSLAEDFTIEGDETLTLNLNNTLDSVSILVQDTSTSTYELSSSTTNVDEGGQFTITLTTQGVDQDVSVPYTISGVSSSDISGVSLMGNFVVDSGGTDYITFNVSEDQLTEGIETFILSLDNGLNSVNVNINDTSRTPSYTLLASPSSNVNEGSMVTFILSTENVNNGEIIGYTTTGDINQSDFSSGNLTGNFVVGTTDSIVFTLAEDFKTEGPETLTLGLDNNQASKSVIVNDTSFETYDLSVVGGVTDVDEGDSFTIRLTTQGVSDGTIPYLITGVSSNDIDSVSLTGNFNIVNGVDDIVFNTTEDLSPLSGVGFEGTEIFTLTLDNGTNEFVSVNINDTSTEIYELSSSSLAVEEGETVTIALSTQGVANGTTIPYTISGTGITLSDFVGLTSLQGEFTVNNDTDSIILEINADGVQEDVEIFSVALDNNQDSVDITIVNPFVFTINTSLDPTYGTDTAIYDLENVYVDWGDGSSQEQFITPTVSSSHDYASDGIYTVRISEINPAQPSNFIIGANEYDFVAANTFFDNKINNKVTEIVKWGRATRSNMVNFTNQCVNLSSINSDLSEFDISNVTDLENTWRRCSSLSSFPFIETDNITSARYTWHDCTNLSDFPLIETGNITSVRWCWRGCSSLSAFPAIDTSSVEDMINAWQDCSSLTTFPTLSTQNVTNMGNAWQDCSSLTTFPTLSTQNVTNMGLAWSGCSSLSAFPAIDTSNVTSIGSAWFSCSSLSAFPAIDTSNVTYMTYAWAGCSSLTTFPTLSTQNVTHMRGSWSSCSSLSTFPAIDTSNVEDMRSSWSSCSSLSTFPAIDTSNVTNMVNTWTDCSSLSNFEPFTNTTYSACRYTQTWLNTPTPFTSSYHPFINTSNDIPTQDGGVSFGTTLNNIFHDPLPYGSTYYYPQFNVENSTAVRLNDTNTTLTTGNFNITGWDTMTFENGYAINNVGIEITMGIPISDVDSILNGIASNIANHNPDMSSEAKTIDLGNNTYSLSAQTAVDTLTSNGWTFV